MKCAEKGGDEKIEAPFTYDPTWVRLTRQVVDPEAQAT
jgi:hypothetical protein